ncbi:MAG: multiprotein bridging factor aMBF1 [Thermoplasmata archaeon]
MLCEMCGKDVATTERIRIDRSVLRLCPECARFGTPVDPPATPSGARGPGSPLSRRGPPRLSASRRAEERDVFSEMGELELVPDWGQRIRLAREARQWTTEELGHRLNEKKSLVHKLESGNFHPPDTLVRKVEKVLGVRLRAEGSPGEAETAFDRNRAGSSG